MKDKYKRRHFLENVCPQVALAMFGVTLAEACSKGDDDSGVDSGSSDAITGYTVNGNSVSIDLDDASFSSLQSRGWMNFRQQNMLLLKLNATTYMKG